MDRSGGGGSGSGGGNSGSGGGSGGGSFSWAAIVATLLCAAAEPLVAWEDCSPDDGDKRDQSYLWRWRVEEYPHPVTQPRYCNRYAPSFVCDPDRVIGKKQADALDRLIERIRNETLCICPTCEKTGSKPRGITLGVALMENMEQHKNVPMSETVRLFAETLRKKWGLGHCDDDILLLISTKDKQSHTLVGPAVSDLFPQEVADQIYLESRGDFSNCLFYRGLESMVQSYFDMLLKLQDKSAAGLRHPRNPGPSAGLIVGIVFGALTIALVVAGAAFLVLKRCDASAFSRKNLVDAWRRLRQQLPGSRNNTNYAAAIPVQSAPGTPPGSCQVTRVSLDLCPVVNGEACEAPGDVYEALMISATKEGDVAGPRISDSGTEDSEDSSSGEDVTDTDEDSEDASTAEVTSSASSSVRIYVTEDPPKDVSRSDDQSQESVLRTSL